MWCSGCAVVLLCDPGQATHPLWIMFLSSTMRQRLAPSPPNLRKSKIHRHENSRRKWPHAEVQLVIPNIPTHRCWLRSPDKPLPGVETRPTATSISRRAFLPRGVPMVGTTGWGGQRRRASAQHREHPAGGREGPGEAEGWGGLGAKQRPSWLRAQGPAMLLPQPEERLESLPPSPGPRGRAWLLPSSSSRAECLLLAPWGSGPALGPLPSSCRLLGGAARELKAVTNREARRKSSPGGLEGPGLSPSSIFSGPLSPVPLPKWLGWRVMRASVSCL